MTQDSHNPYAASEGISLDVSDNAGELAGRWVRFGAALIDSLILSVLFWPVVILGFGIPFTSIATMDFGPRLLITIGGFATYVLVNGYLLHSQGQTIGKKLLGIRVVQLDGGKASLFALTVLRQLPVQLITLVPIAGNFAVLIDVLFIFGKSRRCVHDLIAGTKVVLA